MPGAPAAPPLVLLHALGADSSDWSPVAHELSASWRVHAPDLRGHGASDRADPYTIDQLAADLEAFLDALGLRRVALAGHALGAAPASLFAARHPERVTGLVLEQPFAAASPFAAAPSPTVAPSPAGAPSPPGAPRPESQPAPSLEGEPSSSASQPAPRPESEPAFDPCALALGEEFTGPPASWHSALSDLKVPTLLIASGPNSSAEVGQAAETGQPAVADQPAELAALIPDCQLIRTDPGHCPHADRPADFSATVARFLAAGAL